MRNYPHYLTTLGGHDPMNTARSEPADRPGIDTSDVDARFCAVLMLLMIVTLALATIPDDKPASLLGRRRQHRRVDPECS